MMVRAGNSAGAVAGGLIAGLSGPGRNVTGLTSNATSGIAGETLQCLKDIVPKATKVGRLWDPGSQGAERYRNEIEDAARRVGLAIPASVRVQAKVIR